jgi:hypothetical protein
MVSEFFETHCFLCGSSVRCRDTDHGNRRSFRCTNTKCGEYEISHTGMGRLDTSLGRCSVRFVAIFSEARDVGNWPLNVAFVSRLHLQRAPSRLRALALQKAGPQLTSGRNQSSRAVWQEEPFRFLLTTMRTTAALICGRLDEPYS